MVKNTKEEMYKKVNCLSTKSIKKLLEYIEYLEQKEKKRKDDLEMKNIYVKEPDVSEKYIAESGTKRKISLKQKTGIVINKVSKNNFKRVQEFVDFLEYQEECEATREIMEDPNILMEIEKAKEQFKKGEFVDWDDVKAKVKKYDL